MGHWEAEEMHVAGSLLGGKELGWALGDEGVG